MTVSIVQHVMGTANGASPLTLTITAVTAGNVGCGFVYTGGTGGLTVSDTNNSYTVNSTAGNDTTDGVVIQPFYLVGVVAGTTSLVCTRSGDNLSACFIELHSTTGWTGFRNAAAGQNTSAAATLTCTSSLGASGDVIVAACWESLDQTVTVSDGVMTRLDFNTTPSSSGILAGDSYVLSAASAVTPGFNVGGTNANGAITAMAFTPSSGTPLMGQICMLDFEHLKWDRDEESSILQRRLLVRRSPGEPWHPF